ncbi:hypothetical protein ACIP6V_35100 [Streptomyces sp. NPDC088770]|uniref:hypothetical protein n=1 Tax=Streptomyces sp. NPDC088770 TaxID=3365895 RepID=UPI00380F5E9A
MPNRSTAADKIKARLDALTALRRGGLSDVSLGYLNLLGQGKSSHRGKAVRLRRTYLRHDVPRPVERERNGLPREEQPPAARLIAPRGVAGRLHLVLLFAAHCQASPGRQWPNRIPIEPDSTQPFSWMGLIGAHARHTPGGRRVASPRVNKARQITEALKKLRDQKLLEFPNEGTSRPFRDFRLLCDSGASTDAAPIPYTVPRAADPGIDVPLHFFLRGWVNLLTPSETVAYLMWLDVNQNPVHDEPYVTGVERAGHFGLSRDAYETHEPLHAFGLIDVEPALLRHEDGKYTDYGTQSGRPICHRVALTNGITRNAADSIEPVLHEFAATGRWSRPLGTRVYS